MLIQEREFWSPNGFLGSRTGEGPSITGRAGGRPARREARVGMAEMVEPSGRELRWLTRREMRPWMVEEAMEVTLREVRSWMMELADLAELTRRD